MLPPQMTYLAKPSQSRWIRATRVIAMMHPRNLLHTSSMPVGARSRAVLHAVRSLAECDSSSDKPHKPLIGHTAQTAHLFIYLLFDPPKARMPLLLLLGELPLITILEYFCIR